MVIALRIANQKFLEGDSEDVWGFGQVVALVLLTPVGNACIKGCAGMSSHPLKKVVS